MSIVEIYNCIQRLRSKILEKKFQMYLSLLEKRGLKLGKNVRILEGCFLDPSHCFLISIGDNTVLCPNVRLIAHDASTKMILGYTKIGRIEIGKNCFIGDSTIILPGVSIGSGSIVGAGSIVKKDIPDGTVAAGNPARVIMSVKEYLEKMKRKRESGRLFGPEFHLDNLDNRKREELLKEISKGIGFIV